MISGKAVCDPVMNLCSQYSGSREAADVINGKFASHFQPSGHFQVPTRSFSTCLQVSSSFVYKQLCILDPKKSSPDLPSKLYKAAAHVLSEPLASLFNESLELGIVPRIWKCAVVTPIPKCTSPTINDLRPISLLPIPMKILEHFVLQTFKHEILRNYGRNQFGFRPQSSTTAALIAIEDFVTSALDKSDVFGVQLVAYDLSKAFDKLRYDIILKKLFDSNLPACILFWFLSYFQGRTQCVKIGSVLSSAIDVTSGVPQGSKLGPYLFSMVAGSFPVDYENSTVIKYADDFTICSVLMKNSPNVHISNLHHSFINWSLTQGLIVNESKCKSLCITRSKNCFPIILPNVTIVKELRILGVIFNERLSWSHHCDSIIKTASRRLYVLRVLRNVSTRQELITVYYAIVRSCLEYASPLLVSLDKENTKKLERIQKRFHRLLCGQDCREECLEPLNARRLAAAVKFFQQTRDPSHILHHLCPEQSPSGRYVLPATATNRRLNSFYTFMILHFNSIYMR
ncbi:MAG: reverse transcriptase family protein [Pseudomonadota bacterium]